MRSTYKLTHVLAPNLANRCTDSEGFYRRLEELKSNSKNKSSLVYIYIDDSFYQKAYQWLKTKALKTKETPLLLTKKTSVE